MNIVGKIQEISTEETALVSEEELTNSITAEPTLSPYVRDH